MKLSEALNLRADARRHLHELGMRLERSALVQEGDQPAEDVAELIADMERTLAVQTDLIKRVNRTNIETAFDDARNLTEALADRDAMLLERNLLQRLIDRAMVSQHRYSRSEVRTVRTFDVAAIQQRADDLARAHRELDTQIQALNWATELVE